MAEKASKYEVDKRVQSVAEYLIQGYSPTDIVRNISVKWQISIRQGENYLSKAYDFLHNEVVTNTQETFAFHKKARLDLYRDLKKEMLTVLGKRNLKEAEKVLMVTRLSSQIMSVIQDMGKLEGLYVHKIDVKGGLNLKMELSDLTEEQIAEEIERLEQLERLKAESYQEEKEPIDEGAIETECEA